MASTAAWAVPTAVAGVGALYIVASLLTGRHTVENAKYSVLARHAGFELRRYAPAVKAEVHVEAAAMHDAASAAFRLLAGFIFGGNEGGSAVAMTAPVVSQPLTAPSGNGKGKGLSIAMTAPVVTQQLQPPGAATGSSGGEGGSGSSGDSGSAVPHAVSFVMPSRYTSVEQLPAPRDARVRLLQLPATLQAVRRVPRHWRRYAVIDDARFRAEAAQLEADARAAGYAPCAGQRPRLYSYDPPWVPWWMRRDEVALEVQQQGQGQRQQLMG